MLKHILFFFFVSASASGFGQVITQQYCRSVSNVKDHYNAVEYSIYYPPSWTLDTSGLLETQFIVTSPKDNEEDAFRENVSLRVKDSENLHNFVVGSENWIRNNGSLLESRRRINDARQEYHLVVYTLNEQPELVYEQYYFYKYKFLYELTFVYERAHFLENRTAGEYVLNSFGFKFNDRAPAPPVFILNFR
ncbi:MAG: hypothetical protein JWM14_2312 [Chitinophagaceae bacterium]|nr:hypothetical protein [Chitinophagaceae bacterium]